LESSFSRVSRDMYKKALQTGISLHRGPVGEIWRRGSFTGDRERREALFITDCERYEKDASGSGHLSP